ncbi:sialidase family protein [Pseudoxanthomonas dokdonensis]|uniref:Exo-alpha-sialidase n=1 Tax=Pseudoxanthomonas dokdonensis TaxID=344882 RepID=A0A0R0CLH7_9GAMM|nr:sialidase family protein [Pseudoxanthomonas dokdonensis]KRG70889.1 hypothetical protein ABB29_03340 [Pseudoxanthomonas dokdonensis]
MAATRSPHSPWLLASAALAWLLVGCGPRTDPAAFTRVQPLPLSAAAGAAQPDLSVDADNGLLLSWVEPVAGVGAGKRHRLRFSRASVADDLQWSQPRTVAEGDDWFVNWADTPHLIALADGTLWAHWLRSTGPSPMDYGIALSHSNDAGQHWSSPQQVELPGSAGDHGFVTFWRQGHQQLGMAWLDSRQKAAARAAEGEPAPAGEHHHATGAAMMLRAATFDADGSRQQEWALDASTCDCCTTDSATTPSGNVVVYRGRDGDEVRDIRLRRFDGQRWSPPHTVHDDGWRIAGCPVNGPAVAADGNTLWVAWYTEADGEPEVRIASSDDAGDSFQPFVSVAKGTQVLGRVSLAYQQGHVLLAWLQEDEQGQQLQFTRLDRDLQQPVTTVVASLAARGRASGMPRLLALPDIAVLIWTDVTSNADQEQAEPVLRAAVIR